MFNFCAYLKECRDTMIKIYDAHYRYWMQTFLNIKAVENMQTTDHGTIGRIIESLAEQGIEVRAK